MYMPIYICWCIYVRVRIYLAALSFYANTIFVTFYNNNNNNNDDDINTRTMFMVLTS